MGFQLNGWFHRGNGWFSIKWICMAKIIRSNIIDGYSFRYHSIDRQNQDKKPFGIQVLISECRDLHNFRMKMIGLLI